MKINYHQQHINNCGHNKKNRKVIVSVKKEVVYHSFKKHIIVSFRKGTKIWLRKRVAYIDSPEFGTSYM